MSKSLSVTIVVLLIFFVALPKLLQQSFSAATAEKNVGFTGQLAHICLQLYKLRDRVLLRKKENMPSQPAVA